MQPNRLWRRQAINCGIGNTIFKANTIIYSTNIGLPTGKNFIVVRSIQGMI